MLMETYLRRGRRSLQRLALDPKVRSTSMVLFFGGSGFLLSAAGLGDSPQPLAMGMIAAATGWRALVMSLGAMAGYPAFWGSAGSPGIVWAAAGGLLALLLGKREEAKQQPLMIPAIAAMLTAVTALVFRFLLHGDTVLVLQVFDNFRDFYCVGFVCFFQKIVEKIEQFQPLIFRPTFALLLVLLVLLLNPFVDFFSGQSPFLLVCHTVPILCGFLLV